MPPLNWALVVLIFGVVIYQVKSQCAPNECPQSLFDVNLIVSPDKPCYDIGDNVNLNCTGNMGGPTFNMCNGNGGPFQGWALPSAVCEVFSCTTPNITDTALNVSPNKTLYDARETVTYSCDQGYSLSGTTSASCDADETWNPTIVPTCSVICAVPHIANGRISNGRTFLEGSVASVECNPNYYLEAGASSSMTCQSNGQWDTVPYCYGSLIEEVRLVNGTGNDGRVEIRYNGQWGTICDDHWDTAEANVTCRELGFAFALQSFGNAHFGQGVGQIWMDDVNCVGDEWSLSECGHGGFGNHDCVHGEDAGVECVGDSIRLVGGTSSYEGRVEVLYNGVWGTVCDDGWGVNDARVVCRQLGFTDAELALQSAYFGQGSGNIWLDDLHCSGRETSLFQCSHSGHGVHNCGHGEDASVRCTEMYTTTLSPDTPRDSIRLVGGTSSFEGRVEVLHNGVWGTVCDDYWDVNDARVVCRQLGFTDAETALQNAFFGQGSGIIWLDDLHCSGSETSLFQCSHSGYGLHNCGHNEDASVRCTDPAENVKLHCGSSSFQVDIPKELIDGPHYPSDFYLSGDPYNETCRGFDNGAMYISLNSSLTKCGTHLNDTGTHILYENMVEINPSDGNSVVDFLGIEIPITCEYNSSEKLQTHFKTINEVIRKKAKGSFEFDFAMYTDVTYTVRYYSYPVEMRLNEEMYFRAELLRSASNLEIHLRSCRATPSPGFDNAVVYEFIRAGCGINNSPVRVLTPNQPTQADFEITSFRFRDDLSHPESQVWVHCEVVVCDTSDTNSECRQGCEQSRHRRSVEDPPLKVVRIVQGPIVFKGEVKEETETLVKTKNDDGFRGIFTTILSAVSLVMLIGLIVMGVTLKQVIRNSTIGGYQPVPNPSGTTTA